MKNIERGTIKYLVAVILAVAICGMILYPIFDLVYYKLITNSKFVYSFNDHIIQPSIFAVIFGVTFWTIDKKKK